MARGCWWMSPVAQEHWCWLWLWLHYNYKFQMNVCFTLDIHLYNVIFFLPCSYFTQNNQIPRCSSTGSHQDEAALPFCCNAETSQKIRLSLWCVSFSETITADCFGVCFPIITYEINPEEMMLLLISVFVCVWVCVCAGRWGAVEWLHLCCLTTTSSGRSQLDESSTFVGLSSQNSWHHSTGGWEDLFRG